MSATPKFDAIQWTAGCGSCGGTGFKFVGEIDKGGGDGLLIKISHDDTVTVSEWVGGMRTRDSEPMTQEQVESLL